MALRIRTFGTVLLAWFLGPIFAVLVVFFWPSGSVCQGGGPCELEPVPGWRLILGLLLVFVPGIFATVSWLKWRRPAA